MANPGQKYPTIRISVETHRTVRELAEQEQTSMAAVVAEAIKQYERKRLQARANDIWNRKMEDPDERAYWEAEDGILEGTLMDGLSNDEYRE